MAKAKVDSDLVHFDGGRDGGYTLCYKNVGDVKVSTDPKAVTCKPCRRCDEFRQAYVGKGVPLIHLCTSGTDTACGEYIAGDNFTIDGNTDAPDEDSELDLDSQIQHVAHRQFATCPECLGMFKSA